MSQRLQIVLPDPVATQLHELAAGADTPPSTLAGQMVRNGVALAAKDGKVRPLRPAPVLVGGKGSERAPWLEPYGGDPEWRQQMWGAVVALHGRYPVQLQALKDKWWTDESQTETLCALAVWRAELDDAGIDSREELAFQNQLADLRPRPAPAGRRRHEGMEAGGAARGVGEGVAARCPTVTRCAVSVSTSCHAPTACQKPCTVDLQSENQMAPATADTAPAP